MMSPPHRRDLQLDGLRGLAILLVVVFHATAWDRVFDGRELLLLTGPALGWSGVDLFFVLSGFLITRILLQERGSPRYYRSFYGRRILRILPLYYLVLVLCFVVLPRIDGSPFGPLWTLPEAQRQPLWYWLYLSNVRDGVTGTVQHNLLGPAWSLAIEEQFYLVWPLLVARLPVDRLARLALGLIVAAFALRVIAVASDVGPMAVYTLTPMRMDLLAAGAWIAARAHGRESLAPWRRTAAPPWRRTAARAAAGGGVGFFALGVLLTWQSTRADAPTAPMVFLPWMQVLGYPLALVTWSGLLALLLACEPRAMLRRLFEWRPLRRLGEVSYGVYLFNVPVVLLADRWLHPAPGLFWDPAWQGLHWALVLGLSVALAEVSWRGFESPILRARRWLPYARAHDPSAHIRLPLPVPGPAPEPLAAEGPPAELPGPVPSAGEDSPHASRHGQAAD